MRLQPIAIHFSSREGARSAKRAAAPVIGYLIKPISFWLSLKLTGFPSSPIKFILIGLITGLLFFPRGSNGKFYNSIYHSEDTHNSFHSHSHSLCLEKIYSLNKKIGIRCSVSLNKRSTGWGCWIYSFTSASSFSSWPEFKSNHNNNKIIIMVTTCSHRDHHHHQRW